MAEYTPGWNDPPSLSYSQISSPVEKKSLLRKRVPFPLNHSPKQEGEKHHYERINGPSPVSSVSDTNASDNVEKKEADPELRTKLSDEEKLSFVINTFEKILSEYSEAYEKKRIDEINQRIRTMKDSWNSKLSAEVKQKMYTLSVELSNGNAEAAMKIQCILMVDYLREVKQWMVGVKHIIEMERKKISSSSISSTSID